MHLCGPGTYQRLRYTPETDPRSLVLVEADLWGDFTGTFHRGSSYIMGHSIVETHKQTRKRIVTNVPPSIKYERDAVLARIAACPHLTFVLYTDYPERVDQTAKEGKLPPNVWLLHRVRTQAEADGAKHQAIFLSCLPVEKVGLLVVPQEMLKLTLWQCKQLHTTQPVPFIDWILVHGDGHPCHIEAVRSCIEQAAEHGVPIYVSQLGSFVTSSAASPRHRAQTLQLPPLPGLSGYRVRYKAVHGNCPGMWPEELRVFELPDDRKRPKHEAK